MDPDNAALAAIRTLAEAADWAGVVDVPAVEATADTQAIPGVPLRTLTFACLGNPTLIREIVLIPRTSWDKAISKITIEDEELSPAQFARTESLRRVCRLRCALPADEITLPAAPLPPVLGAEPGQPTGLLVPAPTVPCTTVAIPASRKPKLSTVIDQTLEGEVLPMEPRETRKLFKDYEERRGGEPHADIEPTADQLAGVRQLLRDDVAPYADFSVFGPYGRRLLRRLTFLAYMFSMATGEWVKREIPGPPDFDSWWRCWRVYRTTLLLLEAATTEVLENYGERIREFVTRYGEKCWFIIYQADSRMRSERFERLRRNCEKRHAAALAAGAPSNFKSAAPWNEVFRVAVDDKTFWDEEVRDQCILYLSHLRSQSQVENDGTAFDHSDTTPARKRSAAPDSTPPKKRRGRGSNSAPSWSADESKQDADGTYTHNRRGLELCQKYNSGTCDNKIANSRCPQGRQHQCSKCLQGHAAIECGGKGKSSEGKGKGKGKRKGKSKW